MNGPRGNPHRLEFDNNRAPGADSAIQEEIISPGTGDNETGLQNEGGAHADGLP